MSVMKNLIYYPSFEPENVDWLKFALLYIEKLYPIIPESGDVYLTEITGKILVDTDLIEIHRPSADEGNRATIYALEEIEKILITPERFSRIFGTPHFINSWRQRDNFTHELFFGKYNTDFARFIIANNLGIERRGNVFIHRDLSNIYMSILAQVISDERRISPITDNVDLHTYSIFTRQSNQPNTNLINLAHQIIELKLPERIENISLDRVIAFRNRIGFKERQAAFHTELNNYLNHLESDANAEEFLNNYKHTLANFTGDFIELCPQVISISLGTWLLSTNQSVVTYDAIQHLLGSIAVGGSIISVARDWANERTTRFCKKYLAKLHSI